MYYRLGSIDKDFDFIYDSSDSSCELVSHKELIESGVIFTDRFYTYDYDKFKLICGSRLGLYDETWNRIKMFEYEVSLGCNLNADIAIYCYVSYIDEDYRLKHQFLDSHIIMIEIYISDVIDSNTGFSHDSAFIIDIKGLFRDIKWSYNGRESVMTGVSIPVEMLDYMIRLVKCHDIFALSKMFDGYLLYKLVLKDIVNDIRFRSKGLLEVVDWSL